MHVKQGKNLVIGVFDAKEALETALDILRGQGFRNSDVSALVPDVTCEAHGFAGEPLGWLNEAGELRNVGKKGNVVAAGPLLRAVRGGGALDKFAPALIDMGVPRFDADFYEVCVKGGKALLAVHVHEQDSANKARATFTKAGAQGILMTDNEAEDLPKAGGPPVLA
jgi:hypothetical protein